MAVRLEDELLVPFHDFIKEYCEAYESFDVKRVSCFFAPQGAHCFGTGQDEHLKSTRDLLLSLERDFNELESTKLVPNDDITVMKVGQCVCLCWTLSVNYTLRQQPGETMSLPHLRFTMFMEPQGTGWRIVHAHVSAPLINQLQGHSFPEE